MRIRTGWVNVRYICLVCAILGIGWADESRLPTQASQFAQAPDLSEESVSPAPVEDGENPPDASSDDSEPSADPMVTAEDPLAEAPQIIGEDQELDAPLVTEEELLHGDLGGEFDMPPPPFQLPLTVALGDGFELKSANDEFALHIHNFTQVDYRAYNRDNQATVKNTFAIPRQWFIFSGHLTKPINYYVSLAEAFDNLNILDVFVDLNYDPRLKLRIGRYKTPFTYEFYAEPIQGLIDPERSLFFNNFGINRDLGVMAFGQVVNRQVDYAVGVFNGTRNGLVDRNDGKDMMGYINVRPFEGTGVSWLEHLNFGASGAYGNQDNPPVPRVLRTQVPTLGSDAVGVPWLEFFSDVTEKGQRSLYSLHMAYYFHQLSLIGEWQGGTQSYSTPRNPLVKLPINSFYVQAGYFVTGETVVARNMVRPRRPFDPRNGKNGPGAWELTARYNPLWIGDQVFSDELADPNLWTNDLTALDLGVNWYWNQWIKWMFVWEHVEFGSPVKFNNSGGKQGNSDLYWARLQVYF